MTWTQVYDPLHSWILSTLVAALPILVLFGMLAGLRVKPHWCAIGGAATAVVVAVVGFWGPGPPAGGSLLFGGAFGAVENASVLPAGRSPCRLFVPPRPVLVHDEAGRG